MFNTQLGKELQDIADQLGEKARMVGLDYFTTIFELVDYQQLNEIAAYGGFPTRYPHWRWGMEYERLAKSYTYGLSIIYEMVINNDPCYAYLLRSNAMVSQKTVMAHVYGHGDFFKNNYWFSKTDRKMLNRMANHATIVRKIINEVGQNLVEEFINVCLSLENLIDIHSPFKNKPTLLSQEEKENAAKETVSKLKSKSYMDKYVNPDEFMEQQKKRIETKAQQLMKFPSEPEGDVLSFFVNYAPLSTWQKKILEIIRDEAYYFAPQGQTKILNEGWASYWHSKMMTSIHPLPASEIVDYCDQHAGIIANHQGQLNPYRLGVELLKHVERRWDRGQFGLEYLNCEDYSTRQNWNKETGLGRDKIFEIRKLHNDVTFIDEFLDEEFCHESKMFLYDLDPKTGRYIISSRDFKVIKEQLLRQLANFGQPKITVIDGNYKNRQELLLRHFFDGMELKNEYTLEVLRSLHIVWQRPVHIETVLENVHKRVSFDGQNHSVEKI